MKVAEEVHVAPRHHHHLTRSNFHQEVHRYQGLGLPNLLETSRHIQTSAQILIKRNAGPQKVHCQEVPCTF